MAADGEQGDRMSRLLAGAVRGVVRLPKLMLGLALLTAVAAGVGTVRHLEFHTSRLHLLNPESEFNKRWLKYVREFGDDDDIVVVVCGPGREAVLPVMQEAAARLEAEPKSFRNILWRVDLAKVRAKGLYYLSQEDLLQTDGFLQRLTPVLKGDWSQLNVGNLLMGLTYQIGQMRQHGLPVPREEIDRLTASMLSALEPAEEYRTPFPVPAQQAARELQGQKEFELLFAEGKVGVVLCRFTPTDDGFAVGTTGTNRIRAILDELRVKHAGRVEIGLTGLPIMENDEMRASQETSTNATILSFMGVAVLFWAGFGGWRLVLLSMFTLGLGMALSFGFVTLAVGHLNILTVSFAVILIGLGIDFPVHFCARYQSLREEGRDRDEALVETGREIGPGMFTGMLTTAGAFYVASFTEFTGVAELGTIAGGGVLLCGIVTFWVLPALIRLTDAPHGKRPSAPQLPLGDLIMNLGRAPIFTAACGAGLVGASIWGLATLKYDHNLLNLQPVGQESVVWEHRLLEESEQSAWYALSLSRDPQELLRRKERFLRLPTVSRVEEIASLVPPDGDAKTELIRAVARRLEPLHTEPPIIPITPPQELLRWSRQLGALLEGAPGQDDLSDRLRQIERLVANLPPADYYGRCGRFQQRLADDLWEKLQGLRQAALPVPPTLADLPGGLVDRFVGKEGGFLLKIHARGSIWDMEQLERFVADVRTVDPEATGKPLQTYEASRQMLDCYRQAAIYALILIAVLLYADFRHLGYAALALVPLLLGMVEMFGLIGLLGTPLNPANIVALPVILGIGIDNGVHVVHDFRRRRGRYRLSNSTANALLLCSLTTIVGFGSLMIADHRGIESLGRVMTLGCATCLFNSLVVLPVLLSVFTRNEGEHPLDGDADGAAQSLPPAAAAHPFEEEEPVPMNLETPADDPHDLPLIVAVDPDDDDPDASDLRPRRAA